MNISRSSIFFVLVATVVVLSSAITPPSSECQVVSSEECTKCVMVASWHEFDTNMIKALCGTLSLSKEVCSYPSPFTVIANLIVRLLAFELPSRLFCLVN